MQNVEDMAAEIGIKYEDFINLTWLEFDYYSTGYQRRLERGWDYNRHLIASMFNSSGFAKKAVKPTDVRRLELLDHVTFEKVSDETIKRLMNAAKIQGDGKHN